MRILAVSDLHYRLPHYDWLLVQAPAYDVVALPGDHVDLVGSVPVPAQTVVLTTYLARLAEVTVVLATSGNHDLDGPGQHGEQVPRWLHRARRDGVHVDGDRVDVGGVRFTLCPWWDGPVTRAEVEDQLARDGERRADRWVWLYHSPPAGTGLCRTGQREFADEDLAGWIDRFQPDLVFTGHVHQAPWVENGGWSARLGRTWVFNAGRTVGPVPAHVVVDTAAATAEWIGLPDRDHLQLGPAD